jgi:hypothetical protein
MKLTAFLWLTVVAMSLVGCHSTPTRVDTGVIHARTFSFVKPGPRPAPAFSNQEQSVHAAVHDAITRSLETKGVTLSKEAGDVTVGYLLIVGNNASTTAIDDYFGYDSDAAGLHEKAQAAYSASKNPNYFEAGTLVIDITDAKTYKLLKRGYATRPVLRNLPEDARAARIQEAVDAILHDLRFVP